MLFTILARQTVKPVHISQDNFYLISHLRELHMRTGFVKVVQSATYPFSFIFRRNFNVKIRSKVLSAKKAQYENVVNNETCSCGLLVCLQEHCPALNAASWSANVGNNNILAPYQGSDWDSIDQMLDLADFKAGDSVLDIGAGDGRTLIRSIQRNASRVEGWEIHKETYELGHAHLTRSLPTQQLLKANFVNGNGLDAPIDKFDIVLLYLLPEGLKLLVPKIQALITTHNHSKCKIITQGWPIPNLQEIKKTRTPGGSALYRYLN